MRNITILLLIGAITIFKLISAEKVQAEIAVFSYKPTRCRPITLNENLNVSITGSTNAGCQFNLNVVATGEWVSTGSYFDTPPYGWGGDDFYTINEVEGYIDSDTGLPDPNIEPRMADYSYTCQQPTYSTDLTWLPSYISSVGENQIPGTGTQIAEGKTYTFQIDPNAPVGSSFDIPIRFTSNCTMYRRDYDGILELWSVEPFATKCQMRSRIDINPRTAQQTYTVTVGNGSCNVIPTPLPTSPASPTPSRTPFPTPTPNTDPDQAWFKFKNTSFHKQGIFTDYLSPDMALFDSDDTTDMYPIIGNAGVLTASSNTIDIGSNSEQPSRRGWQNSSFTDDNSILNDIESFLSYAKTQKSVQTISAPDEMQSDAINVISGNITMTQSNRIPPNASNYILIVDGDLTLSDMPGNGDVFNNQENSAAVIVTGNLNIHSDYTELNGIFVANAINLAYNPYTGPDKHVNPLKINGNLISASPINDFRRERTDSRMPTLFIVFKPKMYFDLIPYISLIVRESSKVQ